MPKLIAANKKPVRIWSAACSHGQEVYSIAMMLAELAPDLAQNVIITATDVSGPAVQRAQAGVYSSMEVNPAGMAQESIKAGQLTPDIFDHAREVANIVAASYGAKRVRQASFARGDGPLAEPASQMLARPGQQVTFQIDIPGYPGGLLTFLGLALPAA